MQEKKPTDEYTELILVKGLLENPDFLRAVLEIKIDSYWFMNPEAARIYAESKKYYQQNGSSISQSLLIDLLAEVPNLDTEEFLIKINQLDFNPKENQTYLVKTVNDYLSECQLKQGLMKAVDNVPNARAIMASLESIEISGGNNMGDFIVNSNIWNDMTLGDENYYLYPFVVEENLTYVVADPGTGKTIFLASICNAISKGEDFGPWENKSGAKKILYVEGELGKRYWQKMTKTIGIDSDNFFTLSKSQVISENSKLGNNILLTNDWFRGFIETYLIDNEIKVVVFDNLSSLTPGLDENSKKDFDPINQYFIRLRAMGVTVLVVHHTGKSGDQRGISSRKDQVDKFIYLRAVKGHDPLDGARFTLSFDKSRMEPGICDSIKTKELWFQQTARGNYEWTFDAVRLTDDPEFIRDVISNQYTQRDLGTKYNKSQSSIRDYLKTLLEKDYIRRVGTGRLVNFEATEQALNIFPEEVLQS
jgi:KaiC/GvpD/RAD55 family RecA-like ATPase